VHAGRGSQTGVQIALEQQTGCRWARAVGSARMQNLATGEYSSHSCARSASEIQLNFETGAWNEPRKKVGRVSAWGVRHVFTSILGRMFSSVSYLGNPCVGTGRVSAAAHRATCTRT